MSHRSNHGNNTQLTEQATHKKTEIQYPFALPRRQFQDYIEICVFPTTLAVLGILSSCPRVATMQ